MVDSSRTSEFQGGVMFGFLAYNAVLFSMAILHYSNDLSAGGLLTAGSIVALSAIGAVLVFFKSRSLAQKRVQERGKRP